MKSVSPRIRVKEIHLAKLYLREDIVTVYEYVGSSKHVRELFFKVKGMGASDYKLTMRQLNLE